MLQRFDHFSLRVKLVTGFAVLLALMLMAGGVSVLSHRNAFGMVENYLGHDSRIAQLSLQSSTLMLKARRNERDFLLKVKEYGYEEARARNVTPLQNALAAVRDNMRTVRSMTEEAGVRSKALAIAQACVDYEAGLLRVLEKYQQLGGSNGGLEQRIRQQAHALEAMLADSMPERAMIQLLQLRRHEKNYLQRASTGHVDKFNAQLAQLRTEIERSQVAAAQRGQLLSLLDAYQSHFLQYVAVASEIEADSHAYLGAAHTIEPLLENLRAQTDSTAAAALSTLYERSQAALLTFTAATLSVALLGLLVAVILLRSLSRPLNECVAFAGRVAGGDLSSRLPAVRGKDFAALARSLNQVVERLQQAARLRAMHEAELQRLNRALRVLSQCHETLVHATSEPELLDAICNHLVEIGGYRLAWVGFGPDQPPDELGDGARIAIPLRTRSQELGVIAIYAGPEGAFDTEEVGILQELANDLAFGIAGLRESAERRRIEQELERQANFDTLTGLANRCTLESQLAQAVADTRRSGGKLVTMSIDLDRFKAVNDSLGRAAGDQLLVEVARRLASSVRETDTVARVGGDEFIIIMRHLQCAADVANVAGKIVALMDQHAVIDGHEINTSASIGISIFPDDGEDAHDAQALLRNADLAMDDAKALGGASFRFYAREMNERMSLRFGMEADLRHAIAHGELRMHYQPQLSLVTGAVTGAEALVRWPHPHKGMISPGEFIPLAEESGLILPLGEWILREVCSQLRRWLDAGVPVPPVAVNLSARQFRQQGLVRLVSEVLAEHRLDAKMLHLEITESAVMHDVDAAVAALHGLKALGVCISLDDFGTGYSSLGYLKRFPIDFLKIDQSFVRDITRTPDDAAICNAVIGLAHHLRLEVVAEGVETDAQLRYLQRQRCDLMQGYLFSKPLRADDFARFVGEQVTLPRYMRDQAQDTLLIVDDDVNISRALQRTLRHEGYRILIARNALEALELLALHEIQVIVSDQRMPDMNGTELLSRTKEMYPDTIRLMLTGYAELDSVLDAINRGAIYRFFTKPWEDDALRQNIREAFRHYTLTRTVSGETAGVPG